MNPYKRLNAFRNSLDPELTFKMCSVRWISIYQIFGVLLCALSRFTLWLRLVK